MRVHAQTVPVLVTASRRCVCVCVLAQPAGGVCVLAE